MRTQIIWLAVAILLLCSTASAQWVQTNGPSSSSVIRFAFSGTNLFAATGSAAATGGDGVFLSTDNGTNWTAVNSGLTNTNVRTVVFSGTNLFAGTLGGGVFLSTNNGTSWTAVNTGLTNTNVRNLAVSGTNLFCATEGGVFLSTNSGTSWTAVNTGLTNYTILGLFVSGTNLFAGTNGSGAFLSTNNGTSWTAVNVGLTNPTIFAFALSGTNLFAATWGDGAFVSTDNGTSWTASTGLRGTDVDALTVSGSNVFAATWYHGVFLSTDNGTSWTTVNTGLTNLDVYALAVYGTNIFAGGPAGIWRRPLSEVIKGDTWTKKANMPTSRYGLSTDVVNGQIYAIGGAVLSTVEAYDPVSDTWTTKANMPTARYFLSTSVVNGKIYAIGGAPSDNNQVPTVEEYDPVANTWTKKADMPTARHSLSTSVVNGKIYAIGGGRAGAWDVSTVEVYDPASNTWATKASMPTVRGLLSTSVVNGKIYAIGGGAGSMDVAGMNIVEEYDPATDTWTTRASMPTARKALSASVVDGKIYAIGGVSGSGVTAPSLSTVEMYDPAADTWTREADLPTARNILSTSAVNGKVYAIGGSAVPGYPWVPCSTVEEYTPGVAGAAISITLTSGNNQSGVISTTLANAFAIIVTDAGGNPVSGVNVNFAITSVPSGATGQSLSTATTTTNSSGRASTVLTLGNKAGTYTVTAASSGLRGSPMTLTANGRNPAPTLSSISRQQAGRGSKINVTLTGSNFLQDVTAVSFGADITVNSQTVVSATQIVVNITISGSAATGGRDVTVTNLHPGGGTATLTNGFTIDTSTPTSVERVVGVVPNEFALCDAYPNPFNPSTVIRYELPRTANVSLKIFNALGQEVAMLVNEQKDAGYYQVQWNANVPSGIYFYRLQAGEYLETKKMILLK